MMLERIESLYQLLKKEILLEQNAEKQLLKIQELIHYCWMNYPLRFSDADLENCIQKNIISWEDEKFNPDENTILHIASTVFEVGGHTRWLMNCIDHLPEYKHTLVLTRQTKNIPQNVLDFINKKKVNVIRISSEFSLMKKVNQIKDIIIDIKPFKVFSFHHQDARIYSLAEKQLDELRKCAISKEILNFKRFPWEFPIDDYRQYYGEKITLYNVFINQLLGYYGYLLLKRRFSRIVKSSCKTPNR